MSTARLKSLIAVTYNFKCRLSGNLGCSNCWKPQASPGITLPLFVSLVPPCCAAISSPVHVWAVVLLLARDLRRDGSVADRISHSCSHLQLRAYLSKLHVSETAVTSYKATWFHKTVDHNMQPTILLPNNVFYDKEQPKWLHRWQCRLLL